MYIFIAYYVDLFSDFCDKSIWKNLFFFCYFYLFLSLTNKPEYTSGFERDYTLNMVLEICLWWFLWSGVQPTTQIFMGFRFYLKCTDLNPLLLIRSLKNEQFSAGRVFPLQTCASIQSGSESLLSKLVTLYTQQHPCSAYMYAYSLYMDYISYSGIKHSVRTCAVCPDLVRRQHLTSFPAGWNYTFIH